MRFAVTVAAVLVLIGVAGCTPDPPPVLPAPAPSSTPLFASEEEALAAAEAAYGDYLAISDLIISEGGQAPERLLQIASPEVYDEEVEGFEKIAERGWHSVGSTSLTSMTLQSYSERYVAGVSAVVVYACVDVSGVDVINAEGESVVSESRTDVNPFQASFDFVGEKLMLSSKELWGGKSFCVQ